MIISAVPTRNATAPPRAGPAPGTLVDNAARVGAIRAGVEPLDILGAIANLCVPFPGSDAGTASRMVALLLDGLRYGAAEAG